jgi:HAD superfamily hydrolase (TIGR01490 family)
MSAAPVATDIVPDADGLAVFDLDGTLIRGDSFLPFVLSYARRRGRRWPVVGLPFVLALYAARVLSARAAKERVIRLFLKGERAADIAAHAAWFCDAWVAPRLRPEVVARLRAHQAAGHRAVLLSASPDVYVPHIGRLLGIAEVVCTRVAVADGVCAGALDGANCKGEEKVARVRALVGADGPPAASYAYGDSRSDLPLLRWVRHGYLVRGGGLAAVASEG